MGKLVDSGVSERRRGWRPERTGRLGAWGGQLAFLGASGLPQKQKRGERKEEEEGNP